jgi:pimeloyl-ACP methyl ester carboxylesterase
MLAAGSGRPLLVLGGLGTDLEMLEPLFAELSGFRVISYDVPGCGCSPAPWLPLSMSRHADVARAVLAEDGQESAVVLGVSFGGLLAQQIAWQAPSTVDALVLVSTAVGWGSVPGHPFAAVQLASPPDPLGYFYQLCTAGMFSSRAWLPQLRVPALIVSGETDPLVPVANAELLHRLLAGSETFLLPDGGHMCLLDSPRQIVARMRDFLDERGLGKRTGAVA